MTARSFKVRPVGVDDLAAVARMAAQLVGYHRALDPLRYMAIDRVEEGYAWFLERELRNPNAVVLCAQRETDRSVVGYVYGTLQSRDWNALLDSHGALHDVFVDAEARRGGVAQAMIVAACDRLTAMGAPRVVLHTAVQNTPAQTLFARLGFRPTMIEMTRESKPG